MKESKDVAGRMPRGEKHCPAAEKLATGGSYAGDTDGVANEIIDALSEQYLSAVRLDGLANCLDQAGKSIRSDVRMGVNQDIVRGPMLDKNSENSLDGAALMRPGVELSI